MELMKRKETIWKIKRKLGDEILTLRSLQNEDGDLEVSLGLSNKSSEIQFKMDLFEFSNYLTIINSFKNLIESEGYDLSNVTDLERTSQKVEQKSNELNKNDYNKIEDSTSKNKPTVEDFEDNSIPEDIFAEIDSIKPTVESGIAVDMEEKSNKDNNEEMNLEEKSKKSIKEEILDPTEWDPW